MSAKEQREALRHSIAGYIFGLLTAPPKEKTVKQAFLEADEVIRFIDAPPPAPAGDEDYPALGDTNADPTARPISLAGQNAPTEKWRCATCERRFDTTEGMTYEMDFHHYVGGEGWCGPVVEVTEGRGVSR